WPERVSLRSTASSKGSRAIWPGTATRPAPAASTAGRTPACRGAISSTATRCTGFSKRKGARPCLSAARRGSSADEGALHHEVGRAVQRAFDEAARLDQILDVAQHVHRSADHDAVGFPVQRLDAEIAVE